MFSAELALGEKTQRRTNPNFHSGSGGEPRKALLRARGGSLAPLRAASNRSEAGLKGTPATEGFANPQYLRPYGVDPTINMDDLPGRFGEPIGKERYSTLCRRDGIGDIPR